MIRGKFTCESKTLYAYGAVVTMKPVYGGSPENEKFYNYTPGGEIRLETVNDTAAAQFVPGKEYYVDFTLCE